MKKKMLIDAAQKNIVRVAMIENNNLIDYESEKIKRSFNKSYTEFSYNENQLVGGQTDADYIHSVVCNAYLTRLSHLNIERVRSI